MVSRAHRVTLEELYNNKNGRIRVSARAKKIDNKYTSLAKPINVELSYTKGDCIHSIRFTEPDVDSIYINEWHLSILAKILMEYPEIPAMLITDLWRNNDRTS